MIYKNEIPIVDLEILDNYANTGVSKFITKDSILSSSNRWVVNGSYLVYGNVLYNPDLKTITPLSKDDNVVSDNKYKILFVSDRDTFDNSVILNAISYDSSLTFALDSMKVRMNSNVNTNNLHSDLLYNIDTRLIEGVGLYHPNYDGILKLYNEMEIKGETVEVRGMGGNIKSNIKHIDISELNLNRYDITIGYFPDLLFERMTVLFNSSFDGSNLISMNLSTRSTFGHRTFKNSKLTYINLHESVWPLVLTEVFMNTNVGHMVNTLNWKLSKILNSSYWNSNIDGDLYLPDTLDHLGEGAFRYNNIKNVYFYGSTPPEILDDNVFDNNDNLTKIYVPLGSYNEYINKPGLSKYSHLIQGININEFPEWIVPGAVDKDYGIQTEPSEKPIFKIRNFGSKNTLVTYEEGSPQPDKHIVTHKYGVDGDQIIIFNNSFSELSPFKDIIEGEHIDSNGNVLIRIPDIWVKVYNETIDGVLTTKGFDLSGAPFEGAFKIPSRSVGKYMGTVDNDILVSKSGIIPSFSIQIGDFRTYAQSNGVGYSQYDMLTHMTLNLLQVVFFGTINSDNYFPITGRHSPTINGTMDGYVAAQNLTTSRNTFLGFENLFGVGFHLVDGVNILVREVYISNDIDQYANTLNDSYESIGVVPSSNGFIIGYLITDKGMLPVSSGGYPNTYFADDMTQDYHPTMSSMLFLGSDRGGIANYGPWSWYGNHSFTLTSNTRGTRLIKTAP